MFRWTRFAVSALSIGLVSLSGCDERKNIETKRILPEAIPDKVAPEEVTHIKPANDAISKVQNTPLNPKSGEMINSFGFDIYSQIKNEKGNVFISPLSISTALGMTATAAEGDTLKQMQKVLHLPDSPDETDKNYLGLLSAFKSQKGYELSTANGIWTRKNLGLNPNFKDRVSKYGAEAQEADFLNNLEQELKTINGWVEKNTGQRIKNLLTKDVVGKDTQNILINTIYFLGKWEKPFKSANTHDASFTLADQSKKPVKLMNQTDQFALFEGDGYQTLTLPYEGNDLSMIIALPEKADGLAKLESQLNNENFSKWHAKNSSSVNVFIPKMKIEAKYKLKEHLKNQGMPDAFDYTKAKFNISKEPMVIDEVIHQTFLEVDEKGTEASAATAMIGAPGSPLPRQPKVFKADHPFLVFIKHNTSGAILFMGRYETP